MPILETFTIGRGADNGVRVDDDSVSRRHARIIVGESALPQLEDVGSSYGTFLNGRRLIGPAPLADGARIGLGGTELRVERQRAASEPGRTLVIPVRDGTQAFGVAQRVAADTPDGVRPHIRSGWALKRLDEAEGIHRFVLKDISTGRFVRMDEEDAALFELVDGQRSLHELVAEAERRMGAAGPQRLARLLADLADRGLVEGILPTADTRGPRSIWARLARPRERTFDGAGAAFDRLYERGGFLFFTRPSLSLLATLATAGLSAFVYLIARRYGTPFVVARKVGLGALVFLAGRFVLVALHEIAHGLTVTSFGRRVPRAGLKVMFVFPYAFVDTSDAWFESRGRRLAISAAGPVSDLAVGGSFALFAVALDGGVLRDIVFQLALAAYVGAFFNLNPFLDRDGYNLLIDWLREPGLRRRSRERLMGRLAGRDAPPEERRIVRVYAAAALVWSCVGVVFAVVISTQYYARLEALAPKEVVFAIFGTFYALMALPILVVILRPLFERRRSRETGSGNAAA